MSALDSLTASDVTKSTSMPSWYDAAQQSAVNKATTGVNNMPTIGNTVAGTAINNLSNPASNPFTQAQGTLNTIATGAANPWLTNSETGEVTPNTNTAMGGLFQAQNDQLHKLLPQYEAPATAGSISGGNFGSLRGQTAADTAVTNAQADLFTKQMQEALSNQQTGVNAANALTNVGTQGTTTMMDLGKIQQADPLAQSGALAALMKNITAPTTVTETTHKSPLEAAGALGTMYNKLPTAISGPINSGVQSIYDAIFGKGSSSSGIDLGGVIGSIFNTSPTTGTPTIDPTVINTPTIDPTTGNPVMDGLGSLFPPGTDPLTGLPTVDSTTTDPTAYDPTAILGSI